MTVALPGPVGEVGYVSDGLDAVGAYTAGEVVPELQWPQAVEVYGRMGREDGRAASVLQAIGLPIRRTAWRIEQNGAPDEVTAFVARNLGLTIKGAPDEPLGRIRGRFSWKSHLQTVLLMLKYGHQFFEQVYRIGDDGRAELRKLAPRPCNTIAEIEVARDGGLVGIRQRAAAGKVTSSSVVPMIPVSRLVAYVRDPEPGSWVGQSVLRPGYKHWLLKDQIMRMQAAAAQRNGIGVPVATAPEGETDIDRYQRLASAYRAGDTAGVGLPSGAKMQLLGVQGNLPDMATMLEYHDKQIAVAGLAHFLNLDRGGSYALASVQADTFVQSVQSLAEDIRDISNAHVVEDLVDVNFGPDTAAPRIVFDPIGSQKDAVAASLKLLVDAGILMPDRTLEEAVREEHGLPQKDTPRPTVPAAKIRRPTVRLDTDGALTLF